MSRSNIFFTINKVIKYILNLFDDHMKELHRLYVYLKGIMNLELMFITRLKENIQTMIDSDWGNCSNTIRFIGG